MLALSLMYPVVVYVIYAWGIKRSDPYPDLDPNITYDELLKTYGTLDIDHIQKSLYTESKHDSFMRKFGVLIEGQRLKSLGKPVLLKIMLYQIVKKIAVALIIFIFMDKPWLIIFLFNQVGLVSTMLVFEHRPSASLVDKVKDACNELIFMLINYHLIYFTDYADVYQQLWVGRSVIITLIVYFFMMTGLILVDEMAKFRKRIQLKWMAAKRKARINKLAQKKAV